MPARPASRGLEMSLKPSPSAPRSVPRGFQFRQPDFRTYSQIDAFRSELHAQAASTELIDATALADLDAEGRVLGVEDDQLVLTQAAFGQFCNVCKLPRSYVEALARRDEGLALQVVAEAARSMLHRDESKVMVVDTRTGTVHALIDRDSYNLVPNEQVLDLALSAGASMRLNRGFIDGPNVRITVVDDLSVVEPKVGDVVRLGSDLMTDLGSESFLTARSYNERLRCTNGMTVRNRSFVEKLSAREDVQEQLPDVLLRAVTRGQRITPLMQQSTAYYFDAKGIGLMTEYLSDPRVGGSPTLMREVVAGAQNEAHNDQRDDGELSLWDFVNGVTSAAKTARTLNRRTDLEAMGYQVMVEFLGVSA